eukprot:157536-Pelagomonas_calceolata.AAC.7
MELFSPPIRKRSYDSPHRHLTSTTPFLPCVQGGDEEVQASLKQMLAAGETRVGVGSEGGGGGKEADCGCGHFVVGEKGACAPKWARCACVRGAEDVYVWGAVAGIMHPFASIPLASISHKNTQSSCKLSPKG